VLLKLLWASQQKIIITTVNHFLLLDSQSNKLWSIIYGLWSAILMAINMACTFKAFSFCMIGFVITYNHASHQKKMKAEYNAQLAANGYRYTLICKSFTDL